MEKKIGTYHLTKSTG